MSEPTTRGCAGKTRFGSRAEANEAMRSLKGRKPGRDAEALRSYHCAGCGAFHFGRDPKRRGPVQRAYLDKGAKVRRYWQLVRGEA